jgi:carboxylesterase type B
LYLNVVRPSGYEGKKLPVAFWIHGGTFVNGGGADQRYNLSFIVEQSVTIGKPIIAVSINYRLSLWGFASSKELQADGALNIGLRDQRLAMHWVQENIKAFGGMVTPVRGDR